MSKCRGDVGGGSGRVTLRGGGGTFLGAAAASAAAPDADAVLAGREDAPPRHAEPRGRTSRRERLHARATAEEDMGRAGGRPGAGRTEGVAAREEGGGGGDVGDGQRGEQAEGEEGVQGLKRARGGGGTETRVGSDPDMMFHVSPSPLTRFASWIWPRLLASAQIRKYFVLKRNFFFILLTIYI